MAGLSCDEFLCFAIALGHRGWSALVKGSKEDGQRNIPEELEYPFELGDVCNVWTAPEGQSRSISFTLLLWEKRGCSKGGKAFSVLILFEFAIYFLQFYFKEKMSLNNMVYTYYFILKMSNFFSNFGTFISCWIQDLSTLIYWMLECSCLADFKCIYFECNFPKQNLFSLKLVPWFIVHMALSFGLSISWQQVYGNIWLNNIYVYYFSHIVTFIIFV